MATAAPAPKKGILKQPPRTNPRTGLPIPTPERARSIALTHAHALQIRKSLELSILSSLETLLDFPLSPPPPPAASSSSAPSASDARLFKHHLRFFTPTDYDALLEERTINDRCGYTLCANPKRTTVGGSRCVLVDKGRKTQRFVERRLVERFCDDECARRALWVRVQLREEPAWLRADVVGRASVDERGDVSGIDGLRDELPEGDIGCEISLLEEAEGETKGKGKEKGKSSADGEDMKRLVQELEGLGIDSRDLRKRNLEGGDEMSVSFRVEERETPPGVVVTAPEEDEEEDGEDKIDRAMEALKIDGYVLKGNYEVKKKRAG